MAAAGDIQLEATAAATIAHLVKAVNGTGTTGAAGSGSDSFTGTTADADVTATLGADGQTVSYQATNPATLGSAFTLSATGNKLGFGSVSGGGSAVDLLSNAHASTALGLISQAVGTIATNRGNLGASINQLTAATNVVNTQIQNLTQSESGIMSADIPTAVANMTKYNLLQQTGMAALSQSNQMQQAVLKLLQ
jgi:flagellin